MNTQLAKKGQMGMSLIEVLCAILIFSTGILGLVGLEARATQVSLDAEDRNRASILANEAVALIWTNQTASLPDDVLAAWQSRLNLATSPNVGLPAGTGTITTTAVANAAPITTITIQWQEPSHGTGSKVYASPVSQYSTTVIFNQLDN